MTQDTDHFVALAEQAARLAAAVLMDWRGRFHVREKGPSDLVTEADLASQHAIADFLRREVPAIGFLGEESGDTSTPADSNVDDRWIVDPLDGTTNYVHDLPGWCVSVGLQLGGRLTVGCIYDPISEACYTASVGEGAFCNGVRMNSSSIDQLSDALVAVSLAATVERGSWEVERLVEMIAQVQAFRRLGSAALNLCHLAAGRLDGYWANSVKLWDVAAGLVILGEAGGVATDLSGGAIDLGKPRLVAAANPNLHRQLLQLLQRDAATTPV